MSEFEMIKTQFQSRYDALQSAALDVFKQVFQQAESSLESNISDDQNITDLFTGQAFPQLLILFSTKSDVSTQHIISMETTTATQLYAWMIGDTPAETVGEEQLEGLKEAANQIFGQLTAATEGEAAFTVDGLTIELSNTADEVSLPLPEEGGLGANHIIKVGEMKHTFGHYTWTIPQIEDELEEDNTLSNDRIDEVLGTDDLISPDEEKINVSPAEFNDFSTAGSTNGRARNMDMLLDVELEVQVELGKKPMKIQDVLKLGKGSVIELEKNAGEPLEVFVNNRKLAEGEVVVVDDHFGIRITQLVSPRERINSLS